MTCWGPNSLLRNRGDGTFEDVTADVGLDGDAWSTSSAFGDIDGDGDTDLAVGNKHGDILLYRNIGSRTQPDFAQAANSVQNHFRRFHIFHYIRLRFR